FALVTHISFGYFYSIRTSTGESMYPTLAVRGDLWICSKRHRRGRNVKVGDIISFSHPVLSGLGGVKRVVGMPGDFVLAGTPGVDGGDEGVGMVQVPPGHCWVAGDNQTLSRDSRIIGPVPLALITGKLVAIFWPLSRFKVLENGLKE
ncbi:LexA/Signal peptidase, partial [Lophium mytilinum]